MSTVIWTMLESDPEDFCPDDLGYLEENAEALDELCDTLGVTPLTELCDMSDLEYNMSEEELDESWLKENAKWLAAGTILPTITALQRALSSGSADFDPDTTSELSDELAYIAERCGQAETAGVRVRLLVVM